MPTSITSSGITFDDATTLTTGVLTAANIASGAVTPAKLSQPLTLSTAVATTSGTSIDFTGIPSWVKRITVMLNGVSTNGNSAVRIQVGSAAIATSGYTSSWMSGSSGSGAATGGFDLVGFITNTDSRFGSLTIVAANNSNAYIATGMFSQGTTVVGLIAGHVSLSGALDRIRLTTVNGTDTFDAGSVNIIYEG